MHIGLTFLNLLMGQKQHLQNVFELHKSNRLDHINFLTNQNKTKAAFTQILLILMKKTKATMDIKLPWISKTICQTKSHFPPFQNKHRTVAKNGKNYRAIFFKASQLFWVTNTEISKLTTMKHKWERLQTWVCDERMMTQAKNLSSEKPQRSRQGYREPERRTWANFNVLKRANSAIISALIHFDTEKPQRK